MAEAVVTELQENRSDRHFQRRSVSFLDRINTLAALGLLAVLGFAELWSFMAIDVQSSALRIPWVVLSFGTMLVHSFWVYAAVPAGAGLVYAVWRRRRRTMLMLLLAVIAAAGPWVWSWARPIAASQPGSLTVLSANVLYDNDDLSKLFEQIDLLDPDVILLQEVVGPTHLTLQQELGERYPYAVAAPRSDAFGQVTFSRLAYAKPLRRYLPSVSAVTDGLPHIVVKVKVDGRLIEIHNVHTLPPVSGRNLEIQHNHALALADHATDADGVILAGDFNSPQRGTPVRLIRKAGYKCVHAARGRGTGWTWPDTKPDASEGVSRPAPRTRIDHVLFSPSLECVAQGVGDSIGSDHRPVWASFRWSQNP